MSPEFLYQNDRNARKRSQRAQRKEEQKSTYGSLLQQKQSWKRNSKLIKTFKQSREATQTSMNLTQHSVNFRQQTFNSTQNVNEQSQFQTPNQNPNRNRRFSQSQHSNQNDHAWNSQKSISITTNFSETSLLFPHYYF